MELQTSIENQKLVLKNDLLMQALKGRVGARPPVWVMRQAGRILPEYRAVRQRLSGFKELVTTPELAAEVTVQPVDILGVDAAIIFSDILVIPEAMGLPYEMHEGRGPYFPDTVRSKGDIDRLRVADGSELNYVYDAIRMTRQALQGRVPVIGFAGAPFTLLCYMVEGRGSKTFSTARRWLHARSSESHALLEKITESTITYLSAQIEAGISAYQIFDSWASVLSTELYAEFCTPYLNRIADALAPTSGIIFAKGAHFAMDDLLRSSFCGIGLDWTTAPDQTGQHTKCLQGNLDPAVLYGSDEYIVQKTKNMLSAFKNYAHIANLGHGVYPDTDWRNVKLFIDTVKSHNNIG